MTTIISGSSPSITFSDSTTQTTAFTSTPSVTSITTSADSSISGLTVGKGAGAVSTNTAVGASALAGANTNTNHVAVGYLALRDNTSGGQNVAVGGEALKLNTAGSNNIGIGFYSLRITTAGDNTSIGAYALSVNTSGASNVAIGRDALLANQTASYNTAVGYQAGYTNQTGTGETYLGYQAGYLNTGNYNTFVGVTAGYAANIGVLNSFFGYGSGSVMTSGAKNTIIGGYNGNQTLPYTGNTLDIRTSSGNIVLSDGDGKAWFYINSTGKTRAEGVTASTTANSANVQCDAAGLLSTSTSALKYKTNVRDFALIDINKFRPVVYNSLCDGDDKTKDHFGFIADEVDQAGIKELISYDLKGEVNGFQYERMTVVLTKAIQELKAEFDAYKATHP